MEPTKETETVVAKETPKKTPKKQVRQDASKKLIEELENRVNGKLEELGRRIDSINMDGIKSRLFDVETGVKKDIGSFKADFKAFKESFEKFQKVWGHNEEGLTVNDHFQGQNVEKPFIYGEKLVDEQGNEIIDKQKSRLQPQTLGDLEVLEVP